MVETWEGLLRATGGALQLDKSYWYMIDCKHIGNRWVYRSIDQLPGLITVKVSDDSRQPLLWLEPNQAKINIRDLRFYEWQCQKSNLSSLK